METQEPELLLIGMMVTTSVVCALLIVFLIYYFVRYSGATKAALELVEGSSEAMAFLGSPIKVGIFLFGIINVSLISITGLFRGRPFETSGHASLSIPLSGPRGQARLRVKVEKIRGIWRPYQGKMSIGGKELVLVSRAPEISGLWRLLS